MRQSTRIYRGIVINPLTVVHAIHGASHVIRRRFPRRHPAISSSLHSLPVDTCTFTLHGTAEIGDSLGSQSSIEMFDHRESRLGQQQITQGRARLACGPRWHTYVPCSSRRRITDQRTPVASNAGIRHHRRRLCLRNPRTIMLCAARSHRRLLPTYAARVKPRAARKQRRSHLSDLPSIDRCSR